MKKLFLYSLMVMLMLTSSVNIQAKSTYNFSAIDWVDLYKYLGNNIKYPNDAVNAGVQGNSLILFSVSKGKLKDLKVQNELGFNCDTEVLNKILSFPNFAKAKDGNYALKTFFKLEGSIAEIKNEAVKIPQNYTELKINIIGFIPKRNVSLSINENTPNYLTKINIVGNEILGQVLIVLDGSIIDKVDMHNIDPNQIESVSILKDASAISKYGDIGKNGVITITTKKTKSLLTGSVKDLSILENGKAKFVIRGEKKWGNSDPLVLIDGEIAELNSIDPNEVQSVKILKDIASTTLYGEMSKNGVIIITTKKATNKNSKLK